MSLLPRWLIDDGVFHKFHCVYANEVFAVYSSMEETGLAGGDFERHIPAFLEKREQYLASLDRSADPSAPAQKLPYLLDTQRNRILQTLFPHRRYVMEQFEDLSHAPRILQKEVFKYCVSEVCIELSSFCNRSCTYCPVSLLGNRKDPADKIPSELFERCMEDLTEIEYAGQILFYLFNEPLYDRQFFLQTIDRARAALPLCYMKNVTNGDYLNAEYFRELTKHGLDELSISIHYDGVWNREIQLQKIYSMLDRLEIGCAGNLSEENGHISFYVDTDAYDSTHLKLVTLRTEDFAICGTDRAGTLEEGIYKAKNFGSCTRIMNKFNVSHDGTIVPCCNVCSDIPGMSEAVYGNIANFKNIYSAYTSKKAAEFRRMLFASRRDGEVIPEICRTCTIAHCDGTEMLDRLDDPIRREIRDCWLSN